MRFEYLADQEAALPMVATWYFEQWGRLRKGRTLDTVRADLSAYLNTDKIPLLVLAEEAGQIVGAAHLRFREMDIYPEKAHWLGGVYVSKAFRGRGFATELVDHMATVAREIGVRTLYLQTEALSGGLYTHLGWQALEAVHYHGLDVLVMAKGLEDRKVDLPQAPGGERL